LGILVDVKISLTIKCDFDIITLRRKGGEKMNAKGLYNVKQKGLQKISTEHPNIPAVKRHKMNPDSQMQFATANYLNKETGVSINEIIEIPEG
jgi:hypothetical protein